ncbi:chemotaxis protein CheA [Pseudomonas sp. 148P]|uniref:Chemotaxis protein CheA n=1 Tax=Pseudomonas ulcerans TaxID=3115852 RepID=A0ABU7HJS9_9PSED|nr:MULTISPECIES: chemotaxis protein CheA [unclassified Pseudomonas]MEE1921486.1 chemotaxis protein CheA [Pseudomonas sp. 147P]MEE1931769.1 chemotaxis protein CheA [Pseudomonas sp. 148P]
MFDSDQWTQLLEGFLEEARDLLKEAEDNLLRLEQASDDAEAINALFRAVHTLKGSAGIFSLEPLVALAHQLENQLMGVRDGQRQLTPALVSLMLQCMDELNGMVESIDPQHGTLAPHTPRQSELLLALGGSVADSGEVVAEVAEAAGEIKEWFLSIRFDAELLRNGFEPSSFLRYLDRLGRIESLQTLTWAVPDLHGLDAEACYLGYELTLLSVASREELLDVFALAEDFCTLRLQAREEEDNAQPVAEARETQTLAPAAHAPVPAASTEPRSPQGSSMVKVAAHKLDELINLVGELVISTAGAHMQSLRSGSTACIESVQAVQQHVEQIRERALKLRMVEIGETFNRFHRVVRDVSQALGKQIQLTLSGSETELDKTLIDRIADPLVHLVRNAIDHGIEPADERRAAGKPAQGSLRLNAFHDSGMIVLEVSDDGRGLNTARIREKAVARGMLDADAQLSDQDIHLLIFEPGFSTAEAVSNLSGRGVGMDVVRSAIDELRGIIEIDSQPGVGCTFRVRLPLTLAIIDGFLVSVGGDHFVIPLDMVTECMEERADALDAGGHLNLRGKPLPSVDLGRHFGLRGDPRARRNIVVVSQGRQQAGLIVEQLLGELQTVIKPLGQMFQHLSGISGSTILGSGQVALILDIPSLFRQLQQRAESEPRLAATSMPSLSGESPCK